MGARPADRSRSSRGPARTPFGGSVFGFMRHEALDATDWFAKSRNLGKSELRNQQFGGVVGGPLVRNRTFFFAAYEGLRLRLPQTGVRPVPTRAAREQAVGPVRELLEAFPEPTGAELGDGTAEFAGRYSEPSSAGVLSVRIDHRPSPDWSLFGRYAAARTDAETRGNLNQSLSSVATTNVDTNVVTLGSTGILTPRLVNDLRVNYSGVRRRHVHGAGHVRRCDATRPVSALPGVRDGRRFTVPRLLQRVLVRPVLRLDGPHHTRSDQCHRHAVVRDRRASAALRRRLALVVTARRSSVVSAGDRVRHRRRRRERRELIRLRRGPG